jgi:tRNA/tmRNA/rRNA uracil-C5-methylase (TrmA/RlmC/RlmD family)
LQYKIGDQLELRIERIVPNGFGIGFADGLTVFTPLTASGDCVRVQIVQLKKRIAFAEIVEVLEPSPVRVEPPCQYFGTCGGCDFQQMTYAAQLEAKVAIVRDCLKRIAQIDWPVEISVVPSPQEYAYRSRAQWHVDPATNRLGYLKGNSHDVVDIETCLVLVPELDAELRRLRGEILWETFWDETSRIDAAAGDNGEISIYASDLTEPTKEISSAVADERFAYSAQAFFQGNRYMVDKLVDAALKDAKGGTALDLYSGVGLFALPLARSFENVTAVEENELAVEFARKNARAAGLENIEFIADPVKRFLRMGNRDRADLILLDPPRSGAEPETIKRIAERRPNVISYVSCEPSMLARDLRVFLDNGYSIKFVTVLDMFPQTHHVETVVRLSV